MRVFSTHALVGIALMSAAAASISSVHAQSNIVNNGSFETSVEGWTATGGLQVVAGAGAPNGNVFVFVEDTIAQDLATVIQSR